MRTQYFKSGLTNFVFSGMNNLKVKRDNDHSMTQRPLVVMKTNVRSPRRRYHVSPVPLEWLRTTLSFIPENKNVNILPNWRSIFAINKWTGVYWNLGEFIFSTVLIFHSYPQQSLAHASKLGLKASTTLSQVTVIDHWELNPCHIGVNFTRFNSAVQGIKELRGNVRASKAEKVRMAINCSIIHHSQKNKRQKKNICLPIAYFGYRMSQ